MDWKCAKNNCYVAENETKASERAKREDPYDEIHWAEWQSRWNDPVSVSWNDEIIYEREF